MISFKNLSIKSKITWVIMLTSCTALLIACLAISVATRRSAACS